MIIVTVKVVGRLTGCALRERATMIQQVINCDICGSQKRQSNHWFVASEESGELRISGWKSLHLVSSEAKHLCGEACAHKLISQFLMRLVDAGTHGSADKTDGTPAAKASITERAECGEASLSTWNGSPGIAGSPRSSWHARLEPERLHRQNPCVGRRRS